MNVSHITLENKIIQTRSFVRIASVKYNSSPIALSNESSTFKRSHNENLSQCIAVQKTLLF